MNKGAQMKNFVSTAVVLASLVVLAGCSSKPKEVPPEPPVPTGDTAGVEDPNATMGDTDAGPSGELLSKRIVYFDLDRADIRTDSQTVVDAHAAYLAKHPTQKVRLEGHA